jgi:hypothetical protein
MIGEPRKAEPSCQRSHEAQEILIKIKGGESAFGEERS